MDSKNQLNICSKCGAEMKAIADKENPELLDYYICLECNTKYYLTIE